MKYNAVRAFVQRREYLVWPEDPQDLAWFYEQLVSRIIKDTKVKNVAGDVAGDKAEPTQSDIQPQDGDNIKLQDIRALTVC